MGLLKLDVLGIRMQSAMAYALDEIARVDGPDAVRAGGTHPTRPTSTPPRPDRPGRRPARRRGDVPADPHHPHPGLLPDRVARPARAGRQVRAARRSPTSSSTSRCSGPGPVKSDMVTPFLRARQGWDEPRVPPPDAWRPALAQTCGVVVFHEQVLRDRRDVTTGCGLAEADEVRRTLGLAGRAGRGRGLVPPAARGPRLRRGDRRPDLGGAQGVRLVRVLQGARRGVRPADLPVGLAEGAPPGGVPRRGAHPRPGHVPQAADPRRRPQPRHRRAAARRQRLRRHLPGRAGRPGGTSRRRGSSTGSTGPPSRPRPGAPDPDLPDGRAYGIRLSLADVKGISDAEVARIVAGQPYRSLADFWHRARVSRPVVERLVVAGGVRLPVRARARPLPRAPPRPGHPPRPAAAGRRARPLDPSATARAARPRRRRPGHAAPGQGRQEHVGRGSRRGTSSARRPPGSPRRRVPRPRRGRSPSSSPSTSATPRTRPRPAGCPR